MFGAVELARLGRRCEGRHVLAIQDTSEIHFSTKPNHRRGLGEVGKGNARGVLAHAMVAVDADNGACLGLVGGSIYNRKGRVRVSHAKRALKDKESKRWGETVQAAKPVLAQARMVTAVADRESDLYHYWASAPEPNFHLLSRMMHDRGVAGGGTAWNTTAAWPFVATREVDLPASRDRAARKATLSLRFGEIEIRRPHGKDMKHLPETMKLRLVEVVERDPPADGEPVHWRLLTTHAVGDLAMAWLLALYLARPVRIVAATALLQAGFPLVFYALAVGLPSWRARRRRGLALQ